MRQTIALGMTLISLSACAPQIPDSAAGVPDRGRGVGFDNNLDAARAREAQLASPVLAPVSVDGVPVASPAGAAGPVTSLSTPPPVTSQSAASADPELARLNAEAEARARAANSGETVVNASPSNAAPTIVNNPGISSEQDFGSVSAQRTIEGDAARLASNRAQYEVVAPTNLPSRANNSGPNVVAYALQTSHPVGTRVHRRGLTSASKFQRNCAAFASDDDAQAEFLASGGPNRDRKGLDPDGDGYACGWDPAPFRGL